MSKNRYNRSIDVSDCSRLVEHVEDVLALMVLDGQKREHFVEDQLAKKKQISLTKSLYVDYCRYMS